MYSFINKFNKKEKKSLSLNEITEGVNVDTELRPEGMLTFSEQGKEEKPAKETAKQEPVGYEAS